MTVPGVFSAVMWMDTWIRCWPVASTSEILIPGLCALWKGSHSKATPSCHSCQLCCCSLCSCRGRGGKELSVGCGADGKQLIYLPLPNKYAQHINKISHLSHSTRTQARPQPAAQHRGCLCLWRVAQVEAGDSALDSPSWLRLLRRGTGPSSPQLS